MSKVILEVGETYINRNGKFRLIIEESDFDVDYGEVFYKDNCGQLYYLDGKALSENNEYQRNLDLVEKKEGEMMNKVKPGETWIDRKGGEHRMEARDPDDMFLDEYPIQDQDGEWYTKDGRFFSDLEGDTGESMLDLVEKKEGETMNKVKPGETWIDREGNEHHMEVRDKMSAASKNYPLQDQDGRWYTANGFCYADESYSQLDLVTLKQEPETTTMTTSTDHLFETVPAARKFVGGEVISGVELLPTGMSVSSLMVKVDCGTRFISVRQARTIAAALIAAADAIEGESK